MSDPLDTHSLDTAAVFAKHVAETRYYNLPPRTIEVTKSSILDTLGIIAGGSAALPEASKVIELVREFGGRPESTIIAFGGKLPAYLAAFANGAMAHCLDYDEHHPTAKLHACSSTVPAAFAMAERRGDVSGKELIAAIALGNDIAARLGRAVTWRFPWQTTQLMGFFSATAVAGKLLALDEQQLVDAFGIAFCQAAGSKEMSYGTGSNIRGMYPAFPAKAGVLSALMAQKGISGVQQSFDGKAGLFNLYFRGECDREILLSGLGDLFEGDNTGFKPWPACGGTHVYIDAMLELASDHDIQPDDIAEIRVVVGDLAKRLCEPLEGRQRPATTLDAKFSIPYSVAVAAVRRKVVTTDFSPERLRDENVLALAKRVFPMFDASLNCERAMPPGQVEVTLASGKRLVKRIEYAYGQPQKPMSSADLIRKFRDCVSSSIKPPSPAGVERVISIVGDLENVDNAGDAIAPLS